MSLRQRIFLRAAGIYLTIFAVTCGIAVLLMILELHPPTSRIVIWLALLVLTATVSAALAGALFALRMEEAVRGFVGGLKRTANGTYDAELPAQSRAEFSDLALAFDDMTQHIRAHSVQMQTERDRLRTVLNSMLEGVIAVDAAQRIMLINSAACELFRLRESAAIGRPIWELVRNPRMQKWVSNALGQNEPSGGEMELLDPVSRVLVMNVVRFPMQPKPGAVVVVSDVTELRRLERVRQEFVANASHELKTPLASIKACVETLMDGAWDDPRFREKFLQTIDEQTDRLDALVQDMLALARIEAEPTLHDARPVSLAEVAETCLSRHLQAAERKQVSLKIDGESEPLLVLADDETVEQILDNLLDNAVKYSNPGGKVSLNWHSDADHAVIDVSDTGIGIPQNQVSRIFERFYRVDRHRSRDLGGTGLGLSIVKHLVQSVGGTISVRSRLNQGTTFTVRLPLAPEIEAVES